MPIGKIRAEFEAILAKPRIDPVFFLFYVGFANAAFCRLFGGDFLAMAIVFTATLVGFSTKQYMLKKGVNNYLTIMASAFAASFIAALVIGSGSLILAMLVLQWSIIAIPKVSLYGITEDYFLSLCIIPALYIFFKNYIEKVAKQPTKPSAKALDLSLKTLCAVLGIFFTYMIFKQFGIL